MRTEILEALSSSGEHSTGQRMKNRMRKTSKNTVQADNPETQQKEP